MNIKTVDIHSLKLDPANARKHDVKNIAAIESSLKRFGQVEPLVVQKSTGVVIGGNGRVEAMRKLGLKTVEIHEVDVDNTQAAALGIALNRTAELAEWDEDTLGKLLQGLREDGFDLGEIGFDVDDCAEHGLGGNSAITEENQDDVPEVKESFVKRGEIWTLGAHRLMCGDSTKKEDVERLMGGERADMVFTDPPYGLGDKKSFNNDHKDYDDDTTYDLTKAPLGDSDFIIWGGNYFDWLPLPRTEIGWVVWDKRPSRESWDDETRAAADRIFGQHFEIAITNVSECRGKMIRKTWGGYYGTAGNPEDAIVHKTQKPIALAETMLQPRHKLVLDFFLGSGSTLIACEKTNRRCFGMEIDEHYCSVIIKRWQDLTGKTALRITAEDY